MSSLKSAQNSLGKKNEIAILLEEQSQQRTLYHLSVVTASSSPIKTVFIPTKGEHNCCKMKPREYARSKHFMEPVQA